MTSNIVNIDLSALRRNFRKIKSRIGSSARILCVVKSDAYGHGMLPVARELEAMGTDCFGIFEVEEGRTLRDGGVRTPLLVLKGIDADEIAAVTEYDLIPAVFDIDIARLLSDHALKQGKCVPVHVKVDTGMGRLGIQWQEARSFIKGLVHLRGVQIAGIFSHLSVADEVGHSFTDVQIERFEDCVAMAHDLGIRDPVTHIANSGAISNQKCAEGGLVRPGIMLYGSSPSAACPDCDGLSPVMSFVSRVIQVKTVPAGTPISYGRRYVTKAQRIIATICAGYGDGYSRLLSNKGTVLIRGRRAPVVGTVCMNLTMADVTGIEGVSAGDEVVILGGQKQDRITAEEIAQQIGTISYEVYCAIGKSNRRCYLGGLS
jgi:alanine racemase